MAKNLIREHMLIDTHIHLHFPDYEKDFNEVLSRAQEAGVDTLINVGTDVESSRKSLELAQKYKFIYASAGIHPHDAKDASAADFEELRKLLKNSKMVAIGEIGLDFFRDHSPHDKQQEVFRQFLKLYEETKKPLIIHCRDAYEKMHSIFKESGKSYRGVMHCFSSDRKTMEQFLELGFYISFAGPLTYKKNDVLREACQVCPQDRLLLETDAPFLPPQTKRGQRNEPAYMLETAKTAADLHHLTLEQLAKQVSQNAKALFSLC